MAIVARNASSTLSSTTSLVRSSRLCKALQRNSANFIYSTVKKRHFCPVLPPPRKKTHFLGKCPNALCQLRKTLRAIKVGRGCGKTSASWKFHGTLNSLFHTTNYYWTSVHLFPLAQELYNITTCADILSHASRITVHSLLHRHT